MDNIGDWLYIIFLIIAAISGMRSSNKNKQKRQGRKEVARPKNVKDRPTSREEPLGEPETALAPPMTGEVGSPEGSLIVPEPAVVQEGKRPKEEDGLARGTIRNVADASQKQQIQAYNPLSDPDELKKAVIYAEILNRKY